MQDEPAWLSHTKVVSLTAAVVDVRHGMRVERRADGTESVVVPFAVAWLQFQYEGMERLLIEPQTMSIPHYRGIRLPWLADLSLCVARGGHAGHMPRHVHGRSQRTGVPDECIADVSSSLLFPTHLSSCAGDLSNTVGSVWSLSRRLLLPVPSSFIPPHATPDPL